MISMQTSVISLMILPSPWLCGGSVVNMSSGARESGKCVKTQLQLVCSNYGSGEFVTTSLLIKRDFLMWINVIYKGKFQSSRRHLLPQHAHSERGRRTPGLQPPDPGPPAAGLAHAGGRAPGAAWASLSFCPSISFLPKVATAKGACYYFLERLTEPVSRV